MPERWLQIKGDPSVRSFLFQQSRVESLFDTDLDRIHEIVYALLTLDQTIYMRNGFINRINGLTGMTFSCDGAHYIDHKTFFEKLETFATNDADENEENHLIVATA